MSWEMVLATAAGQDAIRDIFIFVEDTCELTIESASTSVKNATQASAALNQRPRRMRADAVTKALEEKRTPGGRRSYDKPDNATSLRVPTAKLDQFVDLVGELVTVQAHLSELSARRDDPK